MAESVKVMVRCRPMNGKEAARGCVSVVEADIKNNQIYLVKEESKQPAKSFSFDCVFAPDCPQNLIYEQSAFSLVDSVLDGYNGTIFAYGQTGCGKTHTMMGSNESEEARGIIPRTFQQIVTITKNDTSKTHLIRCSFIEIYNEEIHDLLAKDTKARMDLKESPDKGVFVKDLLMIEVDGIAKMEQYMEIGFKSRAVRATNMNAESSRSHSIFTLYIDSQESDEKGNEKYKASKLNLVDLAGSERASKTGATGDGMKQATKINLSLSALGNVISALVDGKTHHIPYRDSKLTRLLQDSLGGNTKTIMIAAVSPANYNYDQTLSTLRYASRAKFIQNKPKVNQDPKDALLKEYMQEIKKLKLMLQGKSPLDLPSSAITAGPTISSGPIVHQRILYVKGGDKEIDAELEQELKNKQSQLKIEQQQKRALQEKLESLQKVFSLSSPDKEDKTELEKIKKLKEKLKTQKKKEEEYKREREQREEELLTIEKSYKSLNEEVDQMKTRFKEIKTKYVANLQQLKDIQNEHEDQKEQLLDTIRQQEKEIKKFNAILNMLMSQEQIDYIVLNSEWSEERKEWNVPCFTYKEKNMGFPKLAKRESIEADKEKKEVVFKSASKKEDKSLEKQFRINNIVKNARDTDSFSHGHGPPSSMKLMTIGGRGLTPLKSDQREKARQQLTFETMAEKRTSKAAKLNPLPGLDSKRHL